MSIRSGYVYETDRGDFAIGYHHEQLPEIINLKKRLIHLFEDRLCTKPKINPETKQPIKIMKDANKLKLIGFSD